MKVDQISVFLENRAGRLSEVADILGKAAVNLRALFLADTSDFGILRLIVNDTPKAVDLLRKAGFTVGVNEVVAVEVPDKPGGLAEILGILSHEEINVEYMYAFVEQGGGKAVLIFRFEDPQKAVAVFQKRGIKLLNGTTFSSL